MFPLTSLLEKGYRFGGTLFPHIHLLTRMYFREHQTALDLKKMACKVPMGVAEGVHAAKAGHPGGRGFSGSLRDIA